jgi:hypothetical protein
MGPGINGVAVPENRIRGINVHLSCKTNQPFYKLNLTLCIASLTLCNAGTTLCIANLTLYHAAKPCCTHVFFVSHAGNAIMRVRMTIKHVGRTINTFVKP